MYGWRWLKKYVCSIYNQLSFLINGEVDIVNCFGDHYEIIILAEVFAYQLDLGNQLGRSLAIDAVIHSIYPILQRKNHGAIDRRNHFCATC